MIRTLYGILFLLTASTFQPLHAYNYQPNPRDMSSFAEMMLTMMEMMGLMNRYSGSNAPYPSSFPMSSMTPMNSMNPMNSLSSGKLPTGNMNWPSMNSGNSANNNVLPGNNPMSPMFNSLIGNQSQNLPALLNGIWQAESGNIMAIYYGKQFLWSDKQNINMFGGEFRIIGGRLGLAVTLNNKQTLLEFDFQFYTNSFTLIDSDQKTFTFHKIH